MTTIQSALAAFALAALVTPSIAEEPKPAETPAPAAPAAPAAPEAPAKPKHKHDPAAVFKKKDGDGDGFLSKDEFTKGAKDATKAETAFGKRDKDGDKKISVEEFAPAPKPKKPKKQK